MDDQQEFFDGEDGLNGLNSDPGGGSTPVPSSPSSLVPSGYFNDAPRVFEGLPQSDLGGSFANPFEVASVPSSAGLSAINAFDKGIVDFSNQRPSFQTQTAPIFFDWDATQADRYVHSDYYKELGFNPYGDNETKYGERQTFGNVMANAFAGGGRLAWNTFWEGWKGWGRLVDALFSWDGSKIMGSPDELAALDKEQKDTFNKYAIFSTPESEKGIFNKQFFGNLVQQGGFAVGALTQFIAEEYLTLGMGAALKPLTGARTLMNLGRAGYTLGEVYRDAKRLADTWKVPGIVKNMYAGLRVAGSGAARVAEHLPLLSGVPEGIRGVRTALKEGATGWEVAGLGFNSFRRTVAEANMAFTEARMEAAGTYGELRERLHYEALKEKGELTYADEQNIDRLASNAAWDNFVVNSLVISSMNRLQHDNLFRTFGADKRLFRQMAEEGEMLARTAPKGEAFARMVKGTAARDIEEGGKLLAKKGEQLTRGYERGFFGTFGNLGEIAKDFGRRTAAWQATKSVARNMFKWELSEGFQEMIQDVSNDSIKSYYTDLYDNSLASFTGETYEKPSWGRSIGDAVGNELTSVQGWKTFLMGAVTGRLTSPLSFGFEKTHELLTTSKDERKNIKQSKRDALKLVNGFFANPARYAEEWVANTKVQNEAAKRMDQALDEGSKYAYEHAKDAAFAQTVTAAKKLNMVESLTDTLRAFGNQFSERQFREAFMVDFTDENRRKASDYMNRIATDVERFSKRYDELYEQYGNLIQPERYAEADQERLMVAKRALQDTIAAMATNEYRAERANKRGLEIIEAAAKLPSVSQTAHYAFQVLGDDELMDGEISLLQKEVESAKSIPPKEQTRDLQDQLKRKEEQLTYLQKFRELVQPYKEVNRDTKVPEYDERMMDPVRGYMNSKNEEFKTGNQVTENDLNEVFFGLNDYRKLKQDQKDFFGVSLLMANPKNFLATYVRRTEALENLREVRRAEKRRMLEQIAKEEEEKIKKANVDEEADEEDKDHEDEYDEDDEEGDKVQGTRDKGQETRNKEEERRVGSEPSLKAYEGFALGDWIREKNKVYYIDHISEDAITLVHVADDSKRVVPLEAFDGLLDEGAVEKVDITKMFDPADLFEGKVMPGSKGNVLIVKTGAKEEEYLVVDHHLNRIKEGNLNTGKVFIRLADAEHLAQQIWDMRAKRAQSKGGQEGQSSQKGQRGEGGEKSQGKGAEASGKPFVFDGIRLTYGDVLLDKNDKEYRVISKAPKKVDEKKVILLRRDDVDKEVQVDSLKRYRVKEVGSSKPGVRSQESKGSGEAVDRRFKMKVSKILGRVYAQANREEGEKSAQAEERLEDFLRKTPEQDLRNKLSIRVTRPEEVSKATVAQKGQPDENPNLRLNGVPMTVQVLYDGKPIGYVTYYDRYQYQYKGKPVSTASMTPEQFAEIFDVRIGRADVLLEEFKSAYAASKKVYDLLEDLLKGVSGSKESKELVIEGEQLDRLFDVLVSPGQYDFLKDRKELPTIPLKAFKYNSIEGKRVVLVRKRYYLDTEGHYREHEKPVYESVYEQSLPEEEQKKLEQKIYDARFANGYDMLANGGGYMAVVALPNGQIKFLELAVPPAPKNELETLVKEVNEQIRGMKGLASEGSEESKGSKEVEEVEVFNERVFGKIFVATQLKNKGVYLKLELNEDGNVAVHFLNNKIREEGTVVVKSEDAEKPLQFTNFQDFLDKVNAAIEAYDKQQSSEAKKIGLHMPIQVGHIKTHIDPDADFAALRQMLVKVSPNVVKNMSLFISVKEAVAKPIEVEGRKKGKRVKEVKEVKEVKNVKEDKGQEVKEVKEDKGEEVKDVKPVGSQELIVEEEPEVSSQALGTESQVEEVVVNKKKIRKEKSTSGQTTESRKEDVTGKELGSGDLELGLEGLSESKGSSESKELEGVNELGGKQKDKGSEEVVVVPVKEEMPPAGKVVGIEVSRWSEGDALEDLMANEVVEHRDSYVQERVAVILDEVKQLKKDLPALKAQVFREYLNQQKKRDVLKALEAMEQDPRVKEMQDGLTQSIARLSAYKVATDEELKTADVVHIERFKNWVRKNLPSSIGVKEEQFGKVVENMLAQGVTVGQFVHYMEVLDGRPQIVGRIEVDADKAFKFHEAFHAVFRLLLTEDQVAHYLQLAEKELLEKLRAERHEPRADDDLIEEAMEQLRGLNPDYYGKDKMDETELKQRLYEEHLADRFDAWQRDRSLQTHNVFRLFFALLSRMAHFFSRPFQKGSISALFYDVNSKKFKDLPVAGNRFTEGMVVGGAPRVALKVFKVDDEWMQRADGKALRKDVYLSESKSSALITSITASFFMRREKADELVSDRAVLEGILDDYVRLYDKRRDHYLRLLRDDATIEEYFLIEPELDRLQRLFRDGREEIREAVQSHLERIDLKYALRDEQRADVLDKTGDEAAVADVDNGKPVLSKRFLLYLSSIAHPVTDDFGNAFFENGEPIVETVDALTVFSSLQKAVANVSNVQEMLLRLEEFGQYNEECKWFMNKFKEDLGLVHTEEGYVATKNVHLLMMVLKELERYTPDFLFFNKDISKRRTYVNKLNQYGSAKSQIARWFNAYLKTYEAPLLSLAKDERDDFKTTALMGLKLFEMHAVDKEISDQELMNLSVLLSNGIKDHLGIHLHPMFVAYSLASSRSEHNRTKRQQDLVTRYKGMRAKTMSADDALELYTFLYEKERNPFLVSMDAADLKNALAETTPEEHLAKFDLDKVRLFRLAFANSFFDTLSYSDTYVGPDDKQHSTYVHPDFYLVSMQELKNGFMGEDETGVLPDAEKDPFFAQHYLLNQEELFIMAPDLSLAVATGMGSTKEWKVWDKGIYDDQPVQQHQQKVAYQDFSDKDFWVHSVDLYFDNKQYSRTSKEAQKVSGKKIGRKKVISKAALKKEDKQKLAENYFVSARHHIRFDGSDKAYTVNLPVRPLVELDLSKDKQKEKENKEKAQEDKEPARAKGNRHVRLKDSAVALITTEIEREFDRIKRVKQEQEQMAKELGMKLSVSELPVASEEVENEVEVENENKVENEEGANLLQGQQADVLYVPVKGLRTDTSRFQPRSAAFSVESVQRIVDHFSDNRLDPIVLFHDLDNKIYVLSGHSRLEAHKMLDALPNSDPRKQAALQNGFRPGLVKARLFKGTQEEAKEFASRSNDFATKNKDYESAAAIRALLGKKKLLEIKTQAQEDFGKNWKYIYNLAHLHPNGKILTTLRQFENNPDKDTQNRIEKIAQWVGAARDKVYDRLSDQHENELFDFLLSKGKSSKLGREADFVSLIEKITGRLDYNRNEPLNLNRIKNKSEGVIRHETEEEDLKQAIKAKVSELDALNDRLNNPKNPDYISPNARDYQDVLKVADQKKQRLNGELTALRKELLEHQQKKGAVLAEGLNQTSLFDLNNLPPSEETQLNDALQEDGITVDNLKTYEDDTREQDTRDKEQGGGGVGGEAGAVSQVVWQPGDDEGRGAEQNIGGTSAASALSDVASTTKALEELAKRNPDVVDLINKALFSKDNKVVDEKGNPLVVYRGVDEGGVFSGTNSAWHGAGVYFSDKKAEAGLYGKAKEYVIKISNPFDLTKVEDTSVSGSGLVRLFAHTKGLSEKKFGDYTFKEIDEVVKKLEDSIDKHKIEVYDGSKDFFKSLSYKYDGKEYTLNNKTQAEYTDLDYVKSLFIGQILADKYKIDGLPIRVREAIGPSEFSDVLKKEGYDGVIAPNSTLPTGNEYVVFDKTQISERVNPKLISESYHQAKSDHSDPELVKAVEALFVPASFKKSGVAETPALRDVASTTKALEEVAKSKPDVVDDLGGIKSFETLGSSVYAVLPDGRTQRFNTATNESSEPQSLTVFARFKNARQEKDFLQAVARSRETDTRLYVVDKAGNRYHTNKGVKGRDVRLAIVDMKTNQVVDTVETSLFPKEGYRVFDQRVFEQRKMFEQKGTQVREFHLGNKVSKINKPTINEISESYHQAKLDGSRPELVKAVEDLLGVPTEVKEQARSIFDRDVDLLGEKKAFPYFFERNDFVNRIRKSVDDQRFYVDVSTKKDTNGRYAASLRNKTNDKIVDSIWIVPERKSDVYSKKELVQRSLLLLAEKMHKDSVVLALESSSDKPSDFDKAISQGRMTAQDAEIIIKSAGLEVPKEVRRMDAKGEAEEVAAPLSSLTDVAKEDVPVMDEETYLAIHGASRQSIGDSALHKNKGNNSDKVWSKIVDRQAQKDTELVARREELRQEYQQKVANGELRPPTRLERLLSTANGLEEKESVQAARRVLEKQGIDWKMKLDGSLNAETQKSVDASVASTKVEAGRQVDVSELLRNVEEESWREKVGRSDLQVFEGYHTKGPNGERPMGFRLSKTGFMLGELAQEIEHAALSGSVSFDAFKDRIAEQLQSYWVGDKGVLEQVLQKMVDMEVLKKVQSGKVFWYESILLPYHIDQGYKGPEETSENYYRDQLMNIEPGEIPHNIAQIMLNDFLNTLSLNQLMRGDEAKLGYTDRFAYAKGASMSGVSIYSDLTSPSLGIPHAGRKSHVVHLEEPIYERSDTGAAADKGKGQLWLTVKSFRYALFGSGKLTPQQARLLDKIERGESVTARDVLQKGDLLTYDGRLHMISLSYFDGKHSIDRSGFVLTKEYTSFKDKKNVWQPIPHREELHHLRERLEQYERTHDTMTMAVTGAQGQKVNVATDVHTIGDGHFQELDNRFWRTPLDSRSSVLEIVDPSKARELVLGEENEALTVRFAWSKDGLKTDTELTVGELKKLYLHYSAERTRGKYVAARNELFDLQEALDELSASINLGKVTPRLAVLQKQAMSVLEREGADPQTRALFALDEGGEPKFNLNSPLTLKLFTKLFFDYFSRGVLQERVPGYEADVLSNHGSLVIREVFAVENGQPKVSRVITTAAYKKNPSLYQHALAWEHDPLLDEADERVKRADAKKNRKYYSLADRFAKRRPGERIFVIDDLRSNVPDYAFDEQTGTIQKDEAGNEIILGYYTEFIATPHSEEVMRMAPQLDVIPDALSRAYGTRRLGQQVSSSLRLVDFLPGFYGDSVVTAPELSAEGSGFKNNQLSVSTTDVYTKKEGGKQVSFHAYGEAVTPEGAFEEFVIWQALHGAVNEKVKVKIKGEGEVDVVRDRDLVLAAMKELGLPVTVSAYVAAQEKGRLFHVGQLNNLILDARMKLLEVGSSRLEVGGTKLLADVAQRFMEQFPILRSQLADVQDDVDTLNGKATLFRQLKEASLSKQPVMEAQLALIFLNQFGVDVRKTNATGDALWHLRMNGVDFDTYRNKRAYNPANQQFDGALTTVAMEAVVAAVNDPEGLLAGKLGLHTDAVRMVSHMLALGVPLEWSMKLMMQPVVREYYKRVKHLDSPIKGARASLSGRHKVGEDMLEKFNVPARAKVLELTDKVLDDNIATNGVNHLYEFSVLRTFLALQQQTAYFVALSDLLPISGGFTAENFDSFALSMKKLQLSLSDAAFERSSIPIDLRQALLGVDREKPYHELVATYIAIHRQLEQLSKTVLLDRTDLFGAMKEGVLANLDVKGYDRKAFEEQVVNDLISVLAIMPYKKMLEDNNQKERLFSLTNGMIYDDVAEQKPRGFMNVVETLKAIQETLPNNYFAKHFLHAIQPELVYEDTGEIIANPHHSGHINKVEVNSWAKRNRFQIEDLQDSFLEIYNDEKTNHLAWALFHYLLVKDGLQWRSGSFMKFIPDFMFQEVLDSLGKVEDLLSHTSTDADFLRLLGVTSKQLLNTFTTHYILHTANAKYIPRLNLKGHSRTLSYSKNFLATPAIEKYIPKTHDVLEDGSVVKFDLWGGLDRKAREESKESKESEGLEEMKETEEEQLERLKFEKNLASIEGRGFEVQGFEDGEEGAIVFPFVVRQEEDNTDKGKQEKVFYRLESVDGKKVYDADSFHFIDFKKSVALGTKAEYVAVLLEGSEDQWAGGAAIDRVPTTFTSVRDPQPITHHPGFSLDGYRASVQKQMNEVMYGEAAERWLQTHSSKVLAFEEKNGVRVQIVYGDVASIRFLRGGVLAADQQALKKAFFSVEEETKLAESKAADTLWKKTFERWLRTNGKKVQSFEKRYRLRVQVNYDQADPVFEFYNKNTNQLAINQSRLQANFFKYVDSQPQLPAGEVALTKEGTLLEPQVVELPPLSEAAAFFMNARFPKEDLLVHRGEVPFNELAMQMAPVINLIEGHPYYEEMAAEVQKTMRKLRC
jgi:hypothetical protein